MALLAASVFALLRCVVASRGVAAASGPALVAPRLPDSPAGRRGALALGDVARSPLEIAGAMRPTSAVVSVAPVRREAGHVPVWIRSHPFVADAVLAAALLGVAVLSSRTFLSLYRLG